MSFPSKCFYKIIIVLFFFCNIQAQNLNLQPFPKDFSEAMKVKDIHKFKDLFVQHDKTNRACRKFNRSRITQKTLNYLFGSTAAIGLYQIIVADEFDSDWFGIITLLGSAGYALMSNGILIPIKHKRKKEMINQYFESTDLSSVKSLEIGFGVQQNGIGIGLSF